MNKIKDEMIKYLRQFPKAVDLFNQLLEIGNVYIMGGLLREYKDKQKIENLKDVDFCIEIEREDLWDNLLHTIPYIRNKFLGYKFICDGFKIDVWKIEDTWAFKEKKIFSKKNEYFSKLQNTVFLSIDGLIYDIKHDIWNDTLYEKTMKQKELDVVLEENPFIELNILRSFILQQKYGLTYSEKLKNIILRYLEEHKDYLERFIEIQKNRYGYIVMNESDLNNSIVKLK